MTDHTESTEAHTDEVLPELPALTDASTLRAIEKHIRDYHTGSIGYYLPHRGGRAKRTKETLLAAHDRFHHDPVFADSRKPPMGDERGRYAPNYKRHTHFVPEPIVTQEKGTAMTTSKTTKSAASKPTKAVATKAKANGTSNAVATTSVPLKSSEKQALMRLMRGDFDALKIDVENFAQTQAEAARQQVEREFASKEAKVNKVRDQLASLRRECEDKLRGVVDKARQDGVSVNMSRSDVFYYWPSFNSVAIEGKDAAIQRALNDVQRRKTRALNLLERERIASERAILLSSLTDEAKALLDNLPTAESLFSRAVEADAAATS